MKKNSPTKRTITTRSLKASTSAPKEQETSDLRRSNRGTPSKKPITPASATRKSERLASSPGLAMEKSGRMEKKDTGAASSLQRSGKGNNESSQSAKGSDMTSGMEKKDTAAASTLQMSDKGENESSQSSKGSDKSGRSSDTSADIEKSNLEELTNQIKKRQPKMTGRAYRALFRRRLKQSAALENQLRKKDTRTNQVVYINSDSAKGVAVASAPTAHEASIERDLIHKSHMKKVNASSNDEELLVVGCSRRIPASNDDARDVITDCPPHADPESKRGPVGETSLEKGTNFSLESVKDTEKMLRDPSPVVESKDDSVIGSPSKNSETQKLLVSKNSLEIDMDSPLKRKRDSAGAVMDASGIVANGDDCMMSSDGVIPSPSGCKTSNLPETCRACKKRQKVNGDIENLSVCSCIAQPVQESDHGAQHMKETGPATSRDHGENRQNMQQDRPYDPKLSSMYPEYWVPVQLSDVQLEQYCWTLYSKSLSLSSLARNDLVGALEETLTSVRKTCDHPYLVDASLKQLLSKNLKSPLVDVEVKASGKLHLLDAMLTQIKKNNFKAVVFYQATENPKGFLLGTILEDFVMHRFGLESYEHVVCLKKKNAVNNFNKESQCFVLLLERRACSQSIKLLRAEAFIVFGSSLNPSQDVKLLERIKIESHSEKTKIFRLYSTCTVEEKILILARQRKPLENLNRLLTHSLLMWGSSRLFDKLDQFHSSEAAESGVPFQQSIEDNVIHEFSSILSSKVGEENEGKLCLLLKVKHDQGTYSTNSTLFGEEHVKLSDEDSPNIFWTKLLGGKNPTWKYCSGSRQRNRKRVQYFQDSEESDKIGNSGNTKKRKKASDDVTDPPVDKDERKGSGKDHMGTLVLALKSSSRSACGTSNGYDASVSDFISGIPEDMLAGSDQRQMPKESQRSLHAVLKPEMAKLCQVLHLSEDLTSMVEKFLKYVIENYHVCEEPATSLQAFQIALSWIAAILVKQKIELKESLVRAKSELAFSCSREEVNYVYSILYCMKSLFLERTQGLKLDCAEKRGSRYSLAIKDIEKTIGDIKRKYKKEFQKIEQKHEEKKVELINKYADMTRKLEEEKMVEQAVISFQCARTNSLAFELKRLDNDYERKFDEITSERDECLKILEQTHKTAKKRSAEDEACWISRIENWVQAELINCAPIKSGDNKHFSGTHSSNTSKHAPDVQTCNDTSGEATCADTDCIVSEGNQEPEAESTSETMWGGGTQQIYEMMASGNDKEMGVSTLSHEQPTDNSATKSQSSEHASITAPEVLIPAGCQVESVALNMQLSVKQSCDRVTSAAPDEDVSSRLPEVSHSCANQPESASPDLPLNGDEPSAAKENNRTSLDGTEAKPEVSQSCANQPESASPNLPLNRDEPLAAKESNRTSLVGSGAENILDQRHEEACSVVKEIRDELALPLPHPAFVVESQGSAAFNQDHPELCPMPSSPVEKQPDTGANIEAAIEPQPAGSETLESGGFAASEQGGQDTRPFPLSPAEIQPEPAANIKGQNIETSAGPHMAGPDAVEIGDSAVSDEGAMGDQDAWTLLSSVVGSQSDLAATIEGQNIITVAQPHTAGSDIVETGGSAASDQGSQDRSPLPFSSPVNHPDTAVDIEGLNNTTVVYPHTIGSDASEREIAECGPQVEQLTVANNLAQPVHEGSVDPSADVTASVPVPSLLNNGSGQSVVQPVPQIPFPMFSDPFQYELEKLRRESESTKKTYEEKKSILKAERERKMAEIQAEYQRKFHEVDVAHNTKVREIATNKNRVIMNKLLASAFLSKCTDKDASHPSAPPRGRIQQLAQRAAIVNALRNYTALPPTPASAPAPVTIPPHVRIFPPVSLQPRESSLPSSVPQPPGLPLNSVLCPMPQPRQPLIYNTSPSASASPVTNSGVTAKLRSPAPHLNAFRPSSSTPATTVTPQSIAYSTVLLQPQQQEQQHQRDQNLGSGLQNPSNDLVCLSDDE